jgi:hypothetical protein
LRTRQSFLCGAKKVCAALSVLLWFAFSMTPAQSQYDAIPDRILTNEDVIEMWKSGLTPRAVILRIRESPCKFDKSSRGLEALRTANVPYKVVLAMMQAPEIPPLVKGRIPLMIPDSTPVKLVLAEPIDTESNKPGYIIYFRVLEDIRIRGLRVIAKGARARARLLDSRDRSRSGESARLEWSMMDVEAVDGQRLPLRGGNEISSGEMNEGKSVGVGEGEEFVTYIYGLRKVNVPPPMLPETRKPVSPVAPNSGPAD